MKNSITLLLISFLIFGCKKDKDPSIEIAPSAPNNLNVEFKNNNQVALNWTDNSTNETGFRIERKSGTSNYSTVGSVSGNVSTYADMGIVANTTYTYRVVAYNSVGNSSYSNEVVVNTYTSVSIGTQTWMQKISMLTITEMAIQFRK
jgi:hypothetical protein